MNTAEPDGTINNPSSSERNFKTQILTKEKMRKRKMFLDLKQIF